MSASPRPPTVVVAGAGTHDPPPGLLEAVGGRARVRLAATADELADSLPGAEIALLWDFRSRDLEAAWGAADRLAWVHVAGAGVDAALFPALRDSEVVLTNSRGVFDTAIAEYTLGLVLAFAKDLPRTLSLQHQRDWQHRETELLTGRRVLVVGAGPIGSAIGRLCRAAGLEVSGVARSARADHPDLGDVHAVADLPQALGEADYVVLAVPLTAETEGLIGAEELASLRPTARLINVARGAVLDEEALVAALEDGRLAGAALDVFATEPLPPDSPLWGREDVIVSPHMSGDVHGWREALVEAFLANLARWEAGHPLAHVVDKHRGYVPTGGPA